MTFIPIQTAGTPPSQVESQKLRRAAAGIEGMFIAQLLKVMQSTVPKPKKGLLSGGDMLGDFAQLELGRVLAERRSIGLADKLVSSIQHRDPLKGHRLQLTAPPIKMVQRFIPLNKPDIREFDHHVQRAARRYGLRPEIISAVIQVESAGNPLALSPKNAKGLMQLTDSTAEMLGVQNIWSPGENIDGGARYLKQLLDRFDGRLELALAAYNAGPTAVVRYGGIPPFPETRAYVQRVMNQVRQHNGATTRVH